MVKRLIITALVSLLLVLPAPALVAAADPSGSIEGQVVNKTPGGGSIAGLEVSLRSWIGQEEQVPAKTLLGPQGQFKFDNLETGSVRVYVVTATYQGTVYRSDPISFEAGQASQTLELAVFEPSTQNDRIRVQRAHAILDVDPQSGMITVMEMMQVANGSDRAYVGAVQAQPGGPRETLKVVLPSEASHVRFSQGENDRFQASDEGFSYIGPLVPGVTQIIYSYFLAYEVAGLQAAWSVNYPVDRLDVLMPDVGIKLSSDRLQVEAPVTLNKKTYQHLTGLDLPANAPVSLQFSGTPSAGPGAASTATADQEASKWLILGMTVVGMAGLLLFGAARRTRYASQLAVAGGAPAPPRLRRQDPAPPADEDELDPELR